MNNPLTLDDLVRLTSGKAKRATRSEVSRASDDGH